MTKCLFKALKAVDLDQHVGSFRSLGYDSAGALANFRAEHFEQLNFNEQELLRLISLLDVLKEGTREGKICPHHFNSSKGNKQQLSMKTIPIKASWSDETIQHRNTQSTIKTQSNDNLKPKKSFSSMGFTGRISSASMASTKSIKYNSNEVIFQRPSTVISRSHPSILSKTNNQRYIGPKSFLSRPAVQHVKVKSYNYGVPNNKRSRNSPCRASHQFTSNGHHSSIFVSSSHHTNDVSYAKPAEIYVYARKRPLLSGENNFEDTIAVPDDKRIVVAETKANLDCTPLLKKTEFEFDQVFGPDASNKFIFESTVLPLLSTTYRHNLTYICFGQTGSGKSHTIFGSKSTDGLLIHCTQFLLRETNLENQLVCSFYEIYNNQVYDLVNDRKRLFVREDGDHHVNVIGVTEIVLKNLENLRCVIDDGLSKRHHGKSAFNSNSSRSHAVFQIVLKNSYDSSESFRLVFIDLAGSERATDAQNNQRQTRREGAQINWSLLALKECIRSMDMTHSHAPFRQSKLTHILRDSLTGCKTRTCLMANVSPPDDCCQCSLNTLQYASRIRDISMRNRHRAIPTTNIHMSYFDDTSKDQDIIQEKPKKAFKPATASTPVHRLISLIDQDTHTSINHAVKMNSSKTKPIDIDWQVADDDIPISGGGDNLALKSLTSSARNYITNLNNNNRRHHDKHYVSRYDNKKLDDNNEDRSSYFPQAQSDVKTSSLTKSNEIKRSYDSTRLVYDDGNERQWKSVPAPTVNCLSNSSSDLQNAMRVIPLATTQKFNDNQYNSILGTESFGTKLTKVPNYSPRFQKPTRLDEPMETLDLNKRLDQNEIITDVEPTLYSDRTSTYKDQTEFYSHRDELLSIVSNRLTTNNRRASSATTPKAKTQDSRNKFVNSSCSNRSKNSSSTTTKSRPIKSASSINSLTNVHQEKKSTVDKKKPKTTSAMNFQKFHPTTRPSTNRNGSHHQPQQRTIPLRVHHSSDSEEHENLRDRIYGQKSYLSKDTLRSTRNEACQTTNNTEMVKKEQEQKDEYIFHEQHNFYNITKNSSLLTTPNPSPLLMPFSSATFVPSTSVQAPLDQMKSGFYRSLEQPIPSLLTSNVNNSRLTSQSYSSPSKDFSVRVSDQLNALRSLLETRVSYQDEIKPEKKDAPMLDSSPGQFAHEFLQSLRQPPMTCNLKEYISKIIGDNKKEVEGILNKSGNIANEKIQPYEADPMSTATTTSSNQHGYSSIHSHQFEPVIYPSLSVLSNEFNQAKVNLSVKSSSTSIIASNLVAKIDTQEAQNFSNHNDDIHSDKLVNENHPVIDGSKDTHENISNPTSDSERTSQVNSTLPNPFAGTSSGSSTSNESRSRSHSPFLMLPFPTYNHMANSTNNGQDNLPDTGKSSSCITGSSFDALLNSLKNMREKELGFVVSTGDDKLIPVAD